MSLEFTLGLTVNEKEIFDELRSGTSIIERDLNDVFLRSVTTGLKIADNLLI